MREIDEAKIQAIYEKVTALIQSAINDDETLPTEVVYGAFGAVIDCLDDKSHSFIDFVQGALGEVIYTSASIGNGEIH